MASKTNRAKERIPEPDSIFLLKIILYFILGCLWLQIGNDEGLVLPVGFALGVAFAMHDHFAIDRKLEFVILLLAVIISFIAPVGFVLTVG
jgi:hypothetical protein